MNTKIAKILLSVGIGFTALVAVGSTASIFFLNRAKLIENNKGIVGKINFSNEFDAIEKEINTIVQEGSAAELIAANAKLIEYKNEWAKWISIVDANGDGITQANVIESIDNVSLIENEEKKLLIEWDITWKSDVKVDTNSHLTIFDRKLTGQPEIKAVAELDQIFIRETFKDVSDAATFQRALNTQQGKQDLADAIELGFAIDIGSVNVELKGDAFDITIPFSPKSGFEFEQTLEKSIIISNYQINVPVEAKENFIEIVNQIPEFTQNEEFWENSTIWRTNALPILQNNFATILEAIDYGNGINIDEIDIDIAGKEIPDLQIKIQAKPGFKTTKNLIVNQFVILFDLELAEGIDLDSKIRGIVSQNFLNSANEADAIANLKLDFAKTQEENPLFWKEIFFPPQFVDNILGVPKINSITIGSNNRPASANISFETNTHFGYKPKSSLDYIWTI